MEEQQKFEQWAVIEIMGHNTIAGFVSEQAIAGVAMLRVDVPAVGDQAAFTKFYGGSAIYAITPTTEEIARKAAERLETRPVDPWKLPDSALRPALVDSMAGGINF